MHRIPYARALAAAGLMSLAAGCALVVRPVQEAQPATATPGEDVQAVSVAAIDSGQVPEGLSPYWDKVRAGETLKIGINQDYPPFGIPADPAKAPAGEEDRRLVGFDADLARHLGQTLGVPIELVPVRSQEVMTKLNDGTIDLAMAGLTRTVFRAGQINFSDPYLTVSQAALVRRSLVEGSRGTDEERRRNSLSSYSDLAQVSGLTIGAVRWTRPHRLARTNFPDAKIVAYASIDDASRGLIAGEVDALVHDDPYIRVWPMFHPAQAGQFRALLEPVTEEPICIGMRKGDLEFLRFLDVYADEVQHDGTVQRLYRRHFVDGAWLRRAALEGAGQ